MESHPTLTGDAFEIYKKLAPLINDLTGGRKLTADVIRPMISQLISVIETYNKENDDKLDGPQKKSLALAVMDTLIIDLKNNGKIDEGTAQAINLALDLFGPAIIDFAAGFIKYVVNGVEEVVEDIKVNGCCGLGKKKK